MRTTLIVVGLVAVAAIVFIIIKKKSVDSDIAALGPPAVKKDCGSASEFFSGHVGRKNAIAPDVIAKYTGLPKEQAKGIADIAAKFDVSAYAENFIGEKLAGWLCGKDFTEILKSIGGAIKDAASAVGGAVKDGAVAVGKEVAKDATAAYNAASSAVEGVLGLHENTDLTKLTVEQLEASKKAAENSAASGLKIGALNQGRDSLVNALQKELDKRAEDVKAKKQRTAATTTTQTVATQKAAGSAPVGTRKPQQIPPAQKTADDFAKAAATAASNAALAREAAENPVAAIERQVNAAAAAAESAARARADAEAKAQSEAQAKAAAQAAAAAAAAESAARARADAEAKARAATAPKVTPPVAKTSTPVMTAKITIGTTSMSLAGKKLLK